MAREQLLIAPLPQLLTHSRFILTLRSQEGIYHGLILFRLSNDNESAASQIYVMEGTCPHLGADMSHADIEELDTGVVAVCPWHRYDFDLKTGKSELTSLRTCTYAVEVKEDGSVYVECPDGGTNWRLVELRPVSEEFADPPPAPDASNTRIDNPLPVAGPRIDEPVVPSDNPPTTLMEWAVLILNTPNPTLKVQRTREAVHLFRTGKLVSIGHKSSKAPVPPERPLREDQITVAPTKVKGRKNRAVMLHALANIEQWAIDLAWDIMARFGPMHKDLPPAFFSDFTKMALDESKHFSLLTSRLSATSPSTPYGSMPVHASLWDSATITADSFKSRLAIIHLVHEARGLDVNPGTIERFRRAGDMDSVKVMEIIHADEVTHVTSGHRWFTWICEQEGGLDPIATFREEVKKGWRGEIKGPFNVDDREKAGLSPEFYLDLRGDHMAPKSVLDEEKGLESMNKVKEAIVNVEYEKAA